MRQVNLIHIIHTDGITDFYVEMVTVTCTIMISFLGPRTLRPSFMSVFSAMFHLFGRPTSSITLTPTYHVTDIQSQACLKGQADSSLAFHTFVYPLLVEPRRCVRVSL